MSEKHDSFIKDGISIHDFEKLVLGGLLILVVVSICVKYLFCNITNSDMVYLSGVLAGSFVARKAFKYVYDVNKNKRSDETI